MLSSRTINYVHFISTGQFSAQDFCACLPCFGPTYIQDFFTWIYISSTRMYVSLKLLWILNKNKDPTMENLWHVLLHIYRSLLHIYRSLWHIYRSLLHIYRSLWHIYRSLWHIHMSLLHICRSLLHIYRSLLHQCRSFLHTCMSLLQIPTCILCVCETIHCIVFVCVYVQWRTCGMPRYKHTGLFYIYMDIFYTNIVSFTLLWTLSRTRSGGTKKIMHLYSQFFLKIAEWNDLFHEVIDSSYGKSKKFQIILAKTTQRSQ